RILLRRKAEPRQKRHLFLAPSLASWLLPRVQHWATAGPAHRFREPPHTSDKSATESANCKAAVRLETAESTKPKMAGPRSSNGPSAPLFGTETIDARMKGRS